MKLAPLFLVVCACGSGQPFVGEPNDASAPKADAASDAPSTSPKNDASPPTGQPKLEMVSGNGGTVASGWPATDPIRVRARDAQGNVVPNAHVSFAVGAGQSLHLQIPSDTVDTDQDGIASVTYNAFPISPNAGHESDTVTATWNGLAVTFGVIITQVAQGQFAAPPLFYVEVPESMPDFGTAKAGTTVPGAIKILGTFQQGPDLNVGVPGYGLRLTKSDELLTPAEVACIGEGGTALADAKGYVTCDLVAPSAPGDYYFTMLAGGQIKWNGHLTVTP